MIKEANTELSVFMNFTFEKINYETKAKVFLWLLDADIKINRSELFTEEYSFHLAFVLY